MTVAGQAGGSDSWDRKVKCGTPRGWRANEQETSDRLYRGIGGQLWKAAKAEQEE